MKFSLFFNRKLIKIFFIFLALTKTTTVFALDNSPRDYHMFPTNHPLYVQYLQHANLEGFFDGNGNEVDSDIEAELDIALFRYIFNVVPLDGMKEGLTVDPQVFIPYGQLKGTGGGVDGLDSTGLGDMLFLAAFKYPINAEKRHFIGFTPYLEIPTGDYVKERGNFNLGANRFSITAQFAWTREIFFDDLTLDLVADVRTFGNNNSFGSASQTREQKHLYQYQAHLAYDITPKFAVTATYSLEHGGETILDGVDQNDTLDRTKYRVSMQYFFLPNAQVEVQYGEDIDVENAFKEESRINLRFAYVF